MWQQWAKVLEQARQGSATFCNSHVRLDHMPHMQQWLVFSLWALLDATDVQRVPYNRPFVVVAPVSCVRTLQQVAPAASGSL